MERHTENNITKWFSFIEIQKGNRVRTVKDGWVGQDWRLAGQEQSRLKSKLRKFSSDQACDYSKSCSFLGSSLDTPAERHTLKKIQKLWEQIQNLSTMGIIYGLLLQEGYLHAHRRVPQVL